MDYRAMVNPTYITAKTSLFLLAGAGNEDARGMIEALGTQDDLSRNMSKDNGGKPSIPEAELKAILTHFSGLPRGKHLFLRCLRQNRVQRVLAVRVMRRYGKCLLA